MGGARTHSIAKQSIGRKESNVQIDSRVVCWLRAWSGKRRGERRRRGGAAAVLGEGCVPCHTRKCAHEVLTRCSGGRHAGRCSRGRPCEGGAQEDAMRGGAHEDPRPYEECAHEDAMPT